MQKQRKKVVIFRKDLLPLSETFVLDQFQSFKTWEPHLAGYRFCQGLDMTGISAFTLDQCAPQPFRQAYLKAFQFLQFVGVSSPAFRRYIKQTSPKLIHAHFGYDAILVYDIAKLFEIPLVVTLHGHDITHPPDAWKRETTSLFFRLYPQKLQRLFSDRNVYFIAVSNALREIALARGIPANRCVVRYTGTDHRYFVPPVSAAEPSNKVLFVGRLTEFKGCQFLLKAMSIVQKTIPGAQLVVIGDGPEKAKLMSISSDLKLDTLFVGAVPRHEVKAWMRKCRLFCLPSITIEQSFETFGMVILEAQFSGLPVITSARGGSESIVHNKTGFVFAEKDYETLAMYIITLMGNEKLCDEFSREARQHVLNNFTLEACTRRIEDYYDEILESSARAGIP